MTQQQIVPTPEVAVEVQCAWCPTCEYLPCETCDWCEVLGPDDD